MTGCTFLTDLWSQSWCPCICQIWRSCRSCWFVRSQMTRGCRLTEKKVVGLFLRLKKKVEATWRSTSFTLSISPCWATLVIWGEKFKENVLIVNHISKWEWVLLNVLQDTICQFEFWAMETPTLDWPCVVVCWADNCSFSLRIVNFQLPPIVEDFPTMPPITGFYSARDPFFNCSASMLKQRQRSIQCTFPSAGACVLKVNSCHLWSLASISKIYCWDM